MIQIDKDVPLPTDGFGRKAIYPFGLMAIGDSFFVELSTKGLSGAARVYGKRHGKKFTVRAVVENGVAGARVWRIA